MYRISTFMTNDNMRFHLSNREWELNQLNDKIGNNTRISKLRDDPLAAAHSVRFQSEITRMQKFSDNIMKTKGRMDIAYGYIQSAVDIMQRINEIAVQGANGIYSQEQMAMMGAEVDQLLAELIEIGNAKSEDGLSIFAGVQNYNDAFRVLMGPVPGGDGEKVVSVDYTGDNTQNLVEISRDDLVPNNLPGNVLFWAENQQIYSNTDALNYRVQEDSVIRIDNVDININQGDNVYAVISRINDSAAPVTARLDPVKNSLVIESTMPHQIWVEDSGNGTVLADLGIIQTSGDDPPFNISDSARAYGGSIFDMVINLRDGLYAGDTEQIGGSAKGGIEMALNSIVASYSEISALVTRLEKTGERVDYLIPELINLNSQEVDLDITKAVTDLKMLQYAHQAALSATARLLSPSLLDFLR
jgi:flagellar hook-associated protein 3 FlgL